MSLFLEYCKNLGILSAEAGDGDSVYVKNWYHTIYNLSLSLSILPSPSPLPGPMCQGHRRAGPKFSFRQKLQSLFLTHSVILEQALRDASL